MDVFAANDIAAFITAAGVPTEITTAGQFDATYTTKAINLLSSAQVKSTQFINPTTGASITLTDCWVHFELYYSATGSPGAQFVEILDSAGTPVLQFGLNGTTTNVRLNYWNGAAWVNGAGAFTVTQGARLAIDLHAVAGAGGTFDLYVNNSLALSLASLNAAVDNFAFVRFNGSVSNVSISQVLVSDQSTVGAKVASLTPNANSATNTAWTNDYTNLVKTGYNDATLVSSSTLGDKEGYAASDVTLPTAQYYVSSVFFGIRARLNSASPQNVKPLMRIGGVDYAGAYNFPQLNSVSFGPSVAAFVNDPSTAAAWSGVANLNAAELGFQTAA